MSALDDALAGLAAQPTGIGSAATALDAALKSRSAMTGSPIPQPQIDPSAGGSTLQLYNPFGSNFNTHIPTGQGVDRFLSGAGKSFSDVGLGIQQILGNVPPEAATEAKRLDAPLMKTGAGTAGNLAGDVAMVAPSAFIPGANGIVGSAVVGGALGAVQPAESNMERAGNTGVGVIGGGAGAALGKALLAPAKVALTPGQTQALGSATRLGLETTPAQQTGSKVMGMVEANLASHPESAGPFVSLAGKNQKTVNTIAAKAIGENADNVGSTVLGQADERLGKVFDSVADSTPVALDPQTYGPQLKKLQSDYSGMLNGNAEVSDNGLFKKLDGFINDKGGATREQLRSLSSNLGAAARSNLISQGGDRQLGKAMLDAQNMVEDAVQGTLSGPKLAEYTDARKQYGTLMQLTARNTVINPSSGDVNAKALANLLMSKDKGGFTMGNNGSDLYEAARFAQAFPDAVGNSGTATRSTTSIGQIPMKLAGALASRAYMGMGNASAKASQGFTGQMANLAADPFAQDLAELLMKPGFRSQLPNAGAVAGIQGRALANPSQ